MYSEKMNSQIRGTSQATRAYFSVTTMMRLLQAGNGEKFGEGFNRISLWICHFRQRQHLDVRMVAAAISANNFMVAFYVDSPAIAKIMGFLGKAYHAAPGSV